MLAAGPTLVEGAPNSSEQAQATTSIEWDSLPPEIQAKVDPRILAELSGNARPSHLNVRSDPIEPPKEAKVPNRTRFIVYLEAQADLQAVERHPFATMTQRRVVVVDELISTAQATQGPVRELLDARQATGAVAGYFPYYVVNGFAVEGDLDTVIALAQRHDVQRIAANYSLVKYDQANTPGSYDLAAELGGLAPANWNIDLVDAERVWNELGVTGSAAIVADFDTGVEWDHPALQDQYRGWDGTNANHNYNWFEFDAGDPAYWDPNGNYGPSASTAPYDCDGHGTHTMGTMVGDGGTSTTQIGMAPGARWIAVPGICGDTMPNGYADDIGGIRTFQWLLCPTDLSGDLATRDCSLAPDVINNSWGSSNPADDTFRPIVQALRAAGIAAVFASGNPSSGLGSIGSPGSIPEGITVGATDSDDTVTSFSGRGPSLYPGVQKPELSAPGANVKSSIPLGGYANSSGTSMAAPHVSGLIALMVSADLQDGHRDLNVDELLTFVQYTALDLGPSGPDDEYGYGRIDAYSAVRWVLGAGELQGAVRDANSGAPIAQARMTGINSVPGDRFTTQADARGTYSTTVPGGIYDMHVEAFGYASKTFGRVSVLTGTNTLVDFPLAPLPVAALTGRVTSGASPVPAARIYVDAKPDRAATTAADGSYTLALPVGRHDITVKAANAGLAGARIEHASVTVSAAGSTYNWDLTPAPTLLLVEADGFHGWFMGRPARNFFQWSLDAADYLYDTHVITDTGNLPTLTPYDVVIWAHTTGSPGSNGSATGDLLQSYLDGGGKLILSGQNIGYWDDSRNRNREFYRNYLHASFQQNTATGPGGTVSGRGFLTGLSLTLNEAAQYSYPNTAIGFSPDGVLPYAGHAYPILMYDTTNTAAALAIDPCGDQNHRAVYLSVGYENLGPRAYDRPPEYAELLDRSIQWVIGSKQTHDVALSIYPTQQVGQPGATTTYDLTVANSGATANIYDLALSGNTWPARILSGTNPVDQTIEIPPCSSQALIVEVDIPDLAGTGAQDNLNVTATSQTHPAASDRASATTTVFPSWQLEPDAPYAASRLSLVGWANRAYLMGGNDSDGFTASNYAFDVCTSSWIPRTPIPESTANHAAAAMDGKIYVIGGGTDQIQSTLHVYDIATDSWSAREPMPEPRWAHAATALNGEIYVIGGMDANTTPVASTYVYSPTSNSWRTVAPMSTPRYWVASAALDGKLYVVGGAGELKTVEEYDPATDTWTPKAPMLQGRAAPGAVSAEGHLYIVGGGFSTYLDLAERYDPATDNWQAISSLNVGRRTLGTAYAGGKILAANGWNGYYLDSIESLAVAHAFCSSDKSALQTTVQAGERITYTLMLNGDALPLTAASVLDPIPAGTTFAGFGTNPIGAIYDAAQNRVQWSGSLPSGSPPLTFTFGVQVDSDAWSSGDLVINKATFDSGTGQVFTRTAATRLDFADPTPSIKTVDKRWAMAGDTLTYTIRIENGSQISDTFTMVDPLPATISYLTGSLTQTLGTASYAPQNNTIYWTGTLPALGTYVNNSDDYQWGDSNDGGDVPGVTFDWIDITETGVNAGTGDDRYYCGMPIGFTFQFYDASESTFCASTNGFVSFDTAGSSDLSNDCPLPSTNGVSALIAALWDDLVVEGGLYYQTFGTAPRRYLVVQWDGVRHYGDGTHFDFQLILYENGAIKVQILDAGPAKGESSTTGIEDYTEAQGLTYACNTEDSIHDGLAVAFVPSGGSGFTMVPSADVVFAATTGASLPVNTWVTNTATITGPSNIVQRSTGTLVNPVDLRSSRKEATSHARTGERVTYHLFLENTGLLPADGATLVDPIPNHTTYVPNSITCSSGTCSYAPGNNTIAWAGTITSNSSVSLTFDVTLVDSLPDMTPVTNTATLQDGYGGTYSLQAAFLARAPSLGHSFKEADPRVVNHGGVLTYTIYVRNSGIVDASVEMRDLLPSELAYVPSSLFCGTGSCDHSDGAITWTGTVPAQSMVPIQFRALAPDDGYQQIVNTAVITNQTTSATYAVSTTVRLSSPLLEWPVYLPIITRNGR
jgi:uncharacterized repeat protein (TIGR01451 family)